MTLTQASGTNHCECYKKNRLPGGVGELPSEYNVRKFLLLRRNYYYKYTIEKGYFKSKRVLNLKIYLEITLQFNLAPLKYG